MKLKTAECYWLLYSYITQVRGELESILFILENVDASKSHISSSLFLSHRDAQRVKIRLRHKETVSQWGVIPTQIYFSHWPAPGTGYSIIFDSFLYAQHCPLPVISFRIQFFFPQQISWCDLVYLFIYSFWIEQLPIYLMCHTQGVSLI